MALSLERFQEMRFVSFDNAVHLTRLLYCRYSQKTMPPLKAGVLGYPAADRGIA
jgi:hypothetical protein